MKHLVGQLSEARGSPQQRRQFVNSPVVHCAHRNDLLSGHIDRVAQVAGVLNVAGVHTLDHSRSFKQIGTVFGKNPASAWFAYSMPGTTDALQP